MNNWMIYGANGYTGRLLAAEAVRRGMRPLLAGRKREAINSLASELGLAARIFDLEDSRNLKSQLTAMDLVMHCAGPFSVTSEPMLQACIDSGVHYLDITGEIDVFEAAWKKSTEAKRADVVVCPGAGFDVVPTDCLAASLVRQLPAATHLVLAFESGGGMSPGTAKTSIEGLKEGGRIRKDGELVRVPLAWKSREVPFAHATRTTITIPWGDLFTAWVSTGIPNIEVHVSVPPATIRRMKIMRFVQPLMGLSPVQAFMKSWIGRTVRGPDEQQRKASASQFWGKVSSADGRAVCGTMSGPNGYDLTINASLGMVQYLLDIDVEGGFYTPSLLMGEDFAVSLPGVTMKIENSAAA